MLTKVSYSMITGAPVNVLDFGAVGDGIANDTSAINTALASAANIQLYFPPGTYKHTGISCTTATTVSIVGEGATLFLANGSNTKCVYIENANSFTMTGMTVDGNQANQTITGTRLNGCGVQTQAVLNVTIQNNTIKNVSTGASIVIGSADPFAASTTTETALVSNNVIRNSGFIGAPFTCDGIYCQLDNAKISDNIIFTGTDFGVALEYSKGSTVCRNTVYATEVGLGGVGVDSCVFSDNTINSCLFRGIFFDTANQPVTAPWISRRTVISGNVINGVGGSALGGDKMCIQVSYAATDVNFVISNNCTTGGDYGLNLGANNITVTGNVFKDALIRGIISDGNSSINFFNNVSTNAAAPDYINNVFGQIVNLAQSNIQRRIATVTTVASTITGRPFFIKTSNVTTSQECVINVYATTVHPVSGPLCTFRQYSVKSTAGVITTTNMLPYSGDTATLEIICAQNAPGIAEILVGSSTASVTVQVYVELISMQPVTPFFLQEA